jgi:hypothetical protein
MAFSALALVAVATSAQAYDPSQLVANAHASSVGGCNCGSSQDQTVVTSINSPLISGATDSPGGGSFADAFVTTEFGTQRAYADAFLAVGDAHPDAQSSAFSRYIEYYAADTFSGGVANLQFAISGSHTPNADVIGPGASAVLNWDFVDISTNMSIASGTWLSTDAPPPILLETYLVPMHDITALRVDFSVSAYAGQRQNPYLVYADYSNTVHTYLDAGAGAPDVVGMSGHDYAAPGAGGVPEPATWAMMILGLGATGTILRSRRAALAV